MIVFLGFVFLGLIACAICGHLRRIADAVEAQNKHYGIGAEKLPGVVIFNEDDD